jgi:hypothetical protein
MAQSVLRLAAIPDMRKTVSRNIQVGSGLNSASCPMDIEGGEDGRRVKPKTYFQLVSRALPPLPTRLHGALRGLLYPSSLI